MQSASSWFSKKSPYSTDSVASQGVAASGFASKLSNAGKGIGGQFKSMGTAVSSAYEKTKNAVKSPFVTYNGGSSDPTSLANMPDPGDLGPEIWVANGQSYEAKRDFAKALDNYTRALELEPANEAALVSTARLYARQGQHSQATEFFNKAIATKPNASILNELALTYQKQGKSAEAQSSVRQAIGLDPANARYRNNLAGMLVASGRSDEAVNELQQVFPPAVANYNVAYLHFSNQNIAAAQQHLQVAIQADPNLGEARELMDKINGSGSVQSAVAAYQTAGNIYRTAEAVTRPFVPATQAVYQMQPPTAEQ